MLCIKSLMFCAFLSLFEVRAEILDESHKKFIAPTATLPIVLKLSESIQTAKHEYLKSVEEENTNVVANHRNYESLSNDIEVFKEKLGPQMEKQEEEPEPDAEVEEETPPEEPKDEEGEPAVEPEADVAAEEEAKPAAESEVEEPAEDAAEPAPEDVADGVPEEGAEPAAEPEAEPPAEPETEVEPKPKPELENEANGNEETVLDDVTNVPVVENNAESEMANDEPAKEDNDEEKKDVKENETKSVVTKDTEKKEDSCFSCTSNEDAKCSTKPKQEIRCPKVNKGDEGKHNGCYTLYQADTNTTMRGCVDDLAEEGLKYCLTHDKFCRVCYNNGCNNKVAPSNATKLYFNFYTLIFFNITFIILIKKFLFI